MGRIKKAKCLTNDSTTYLSLARHAAKAEAYRDAIEQITRYPIGQACERLQFKYQQALKASTEMSTVIEAARQQKKALK